MARISSDQLRELEAAGKVARGSTIQAPAPDAVPRRANKFGVSAKDKRTVDGIVFASKIEAERYKELVQLVQITFALGVPENKYRVDFLVFHGYGEVWAEDTKGMTRPADLKNFKLWERYAPCDLRVMKRKKIEWQTQIVRGKK